MVDIARQERIMDVPSLIGSHCSGDHPDTPVCGSIMAGRLTVEKLAISATTCRRCYQMTLPEDAYYRYHTNAELFLLDTCMPLRRHRVPENSAFRRASAGACVEAEEMLS